MTGAHTKSTSMIVAGKRVEVRTYMATDGTWSATAIGYRFFGRGATEQEAVRSFCSIANYAMAHTRAHGLPWPSSD